jgi:hypothetical protein
MRWGFYILLLFWLFFAACKKTGSIGAKSTVDSNKIDSTAQVRTYPFTDTFYGEYNEHNDDISPYDFSGYSTVLIHHVNSDSIVIDAQSIGLPHGSMSFPCIIDISERVSISNIYTFYVQWYYDRSDRYICTINDDSLQCIISQTTAGAAYGIYNGSYTGFKK